MLRLLCFRNGWEIAEIGLRKIAVIVIVIRKIEVKRPLRVILIWVTSIWAIRVTVILLMLLQRKKIEIKWISRKLTIKSVQWINRILILAVTKIQIIIRRRCRWTKCAALILESLFQSTLRLDQKPLRKDRTKYQARTITTIWWRKSRVSHFSGWVPKYLWGDTRYILLYLQPKRIIKNTQIRQSCASVDPLGFADGFFSFFNAEHQYLVQS